MLAAGVLSAVAIFVPSSASAFRCANIVGVGDPCAKVCQLLGPLAGKVTLCRLT